jgi:hypothetical protein
MDPSGDRPVNGHPADDDPPHDDRAPAVTSGSDEHGHGAVFWIGLVVGWTAIAIGIFGVLDHPSSASAFKVFRLLIGLNVVNDAIVVPVLLLLAVVVHKWAPPWLVVPAQVWFIMAGAVTLYAYPLVGGFGKSKANPSQLPFDYAHNLLIVLGGITALCGGLAFHSWQRYRSSQA